MQTIAAMRHACLDRIEEAFVTAEQHYNVVLPRVPIEFSNKLKSTAGLAHYSRNRFTGKCAGVKIKLSVPLLRLNGDEFIGRTPGHEAAHIIAANLFNERGHGNAWKQVMRVIGQKAERCHQMEVATPNRVDAHCGVGCTAVHKITKARATKMTRGTRYLCSRCRQPLKLGSADNTMVLAAERRRPQAMPTVESLHMPTAPKRVSKSGTSKADMVRTLISNNPTASEDELVLLVQASSIGVKPNLVRKYVQGNMAKVRG